ncbi:MAG TPA: hypothetical protein VK815_14525 [Candidatus Acidoferrales bacterium]|nr:hypothetical protein [Candidatus Acidoferrales bacterium]
MNAFAKTGLFFTTALLFCHATRGDFQDDIGLRAMRATASLDGSGIRLAQPEAGFGSATNWEVNPSAIWVLQPAGKFTYSSSSGTATNYPNAVGSDSGHAEFNVGGFCYGLPFGIATNLSHIDNYEANYFIDDIVVLASPIAAPLVNQSFVDPDTNDEVVLDAAYDDYAAQYGTLFISGVDNGGPVKPPSTCYNGIGAGAYQDYANHTSIGPTPAGGRCKPDITAISDSASTGTALVSGAAALLLQAALRGDGGSDTNSTADLRTLKALLLNGAVKPVDWTNAGASPLDARYGAGVVNILNSYEQLAGGKHGVTISNTVSLNAAHPPTGAMGDVGVLSGWNLATNASGILNDSIHHYYFNVSNGVTSAKYTATATLVWLRQQGMTDINNLDLFLYNCANSNLVACSTSQVDNVEHIWTTGLAPGRYDLQVWKAGGIGPVSLDETYALAFEFVPQPVVSVSGGTNPCVTWPLYPAGYLVEARTNLLVGAWSTNGLPTVPVITNGLNSIPLGPANALQFFRLRKPNL